MDLELKSAGALETFYSPSHQIQSVSPIWQKDKAETEEMEPTASDAEEQGALHHQEEQENNNDSTVNEDPMAALEWENGIGTLAGSDIKFRVNENGDIEVITEDVDFEINSTQNDIQEGKNCPDGENDPAAPEDPHPGTTEQEDTPMVETSEQDEEVHGETAMENEHDAQEVKNMVADSLGMEEPNGVLNKDAEAVAEENLELEEAEPGSPRNAEQQEDHQEKQNCAEEVPLDDSTLEDNLDTFDPVLSEDIATMLYENAENHDGDDGADNKNSSNSSTVSRDGGKPFSAADNAAAPVAAEPAKPEKPYLHPPQDKCIICGRPSKLRRFCSRQCLGKNAAMTRKAAYRAGTIKKLKYKKKTRSSSFEKEHGMMPHPNDVLTVVQDETGGKRNDLKIKIRWSSSSSEQIAEPLPPKRRATSTGAYTTGSRGSRRKKFTWANYLQEENATAAHPDAFQDVTGKDPFPGDNPFQCNMALEGVDPEHESLICALAIAEVQGCRIRLRFCGYAECFDFWRNVDSPLIFPCGFCQETGRTLQPPKGYADGEFSWDEYLEEYGLIPAHKEYFASSTTGVKCPFDVGVKIEAVDKHNPELVCVATVQDVINDQLLIHFDGWNHDYDYWCHYTSQYIHPVGWCKENNKHLTPPDNYRESEEFSWTRYIAATQLKLPTESAFTKKTHKFKAGMKLEAVDPRNKILVRVATIVEIKGFEAKIHFDGWSDMYDFWTNLESLEIHPMGWCRKTGHSLQPPVTHDDLLDSSWQGSGCPIPGCTGIGHVRGSKFMNHYSEFGCPYSPQNLAKEPIKDRLTQYRTRKSVHNVEDENSFNDDDPDYAAFYAKRTENTSVFTRRRRSTLVSSSPPPNLDRKRRSFDRTEPITHKVNGAKGNTAKTVAKWSIVEVANFIEGLTNNRMYSSIFAREEIDGEAILMLTQSDICRVLNIKLGPAIKIYNAILTIKEAD